MSKAYFDMSEKGKHSLMSNNSLYSCTKLYKLTRVHL